MSEEEDLYEMEQAAKRRRARLSKAPMAAGDFDDFIKASSVDKKRSIMDTMRKRKRFMPALGQRIYWDRREFGISLSQSLIRYMVDPEDHKRYMKESKKYKRYIAKSKQVAKEWWLSQIGTMALTNKGSPELLRIHLRNEFGLELDSNLNAEEKYGFNVTIRPRGDGEERN